MLTCDCVVMLPRVFPEGTSWEGGTQFAGRVLDRMQHYTAHVTWPRRLAARVTARWDAWWCGATIFREGAASAGQRVDLIVREATRERIQIMNFRI